MEKKPTVARVNLDDLINKLKEMHTKSRPSEHNLAAFKKWKSGWHGINRRSVTDALAQTHPVFWPGKAPATMEQLLIMVLLLSAPRGRRPFPPRAAPPKQ